MISARSCGNAQKFFVDGMPLRRAALSLVLVLLGAVSAEAEVKNVKITLD
jgi:hypothetical protein